MRQLALLPVALCLVASLGDYEARSLLQDKVTVYYAVEGLNCERCAVDLKSVVEEINGVIEVFASYDDKSLVVTFDSSIVSKERIETTVSEKTHFRIFARRMEDG